MQKWGFRQRPKASAKLLNLFIVAINGIKATASPASVHKEQTSALG
jgi:hypothetical protein